MSNVYDFDQARQSFQTQAGQAIGEAEHSPDDAAQAFTLSKATGVPASHIAENQDDFTKLVKGRLANNILSDNHPLTAFTNSDPLHPSLIKDDISNLDDVTKSLDKARWDPIGEGFKAYSQAHDAFTKGDQGAFDSASQRLARGAVRGRTLSSPQVPLDWATWGNLAEAVAKRYPHPPTDIRDLPNWIRENPEAIGTVLGMIVPPIEGNLGVAPRSKVQEFIDLADRIQAQQQAAQATQRAQQMGEAVREGERAAEAAQPPQLALPSPEQIQSVVEEFNKVKPWAEAGVEPIPTVSTVADFAKEAQAKVEQESLKDAVDAAAKSDLRERMPEKFEEFIDHHPDAIVSISPDAIAKNPEAFKWLGPTGQGKVDVPMGQFLANFDKKDWDSVKDDISLGGLTKNDIDTIKEVPFEPIVGDNVDQIRQATGLTAWHGTPNEFQQFAMKFMGAGQGAQSFGPGHYFAEEPKVAEDTLKGILEGRSDETKLVNREGKSIDIEGDRALLSGIMIHHNNDLDAARRYYEQALTDEGITPESERALHDAIDTIKDWQAQGAKIQEPKGHLLKVNLNVDKNLMLDYDKILTEQTPEVQAILRKLGITPTNEVYIKNVTKALNDLKEDFATAEGERKTRIGESIRRTEEMIEDAKHITVDETIHRLRDQGASQAALTDTEAADKRWRALPKKLSDAGLHGIRYLDQASRNQFDLVDLKRQLNKWNEWKGQEEYSTNPDEKARVDKGIVDIEAAIKREEAKPTTSNYVIFDDNRIKITHRNGEPVPEALRRQVLERGRTGRPVRTAKMNFGADTDILEAGFDKALPEQEREPFTGGKAMGISEKLYNNLLKKIQAMTSDDAKWRARRAEAQAKLERSNEWAAEKAKLEPVIRAKIENMRIVAAWQRMKKIKFDPMYVRPAERAEIPELVGLGGIKPDDIAGDFGYSTGQELINDMRGLAAEAKAGKGDIVDRLVNRQLDLELQARLGKTPLERLDEEIDHALSLTALELLHEKIVAMAAQIGAQAPMSKYAMNWGSKQELESKLFQGLSARRLLEQTVVEAKKVQRAMAAGKMQEAFLALQNQYNLSVQAKIMREVEKESKQFDRTAKRFRPREIKNFPIEYANFIQQILKMVGKTVERSDKDLADVIKLVADQGGAKDFDSFVDRLITKEGWIAPVASFLRDGTAKALNKMTVGDARALFDTVRTIAKRGRELESVEVAGKKMDFNDVRNEIVDMIAQVGPARAGPLRGGPVRKVTDLIKAFHYANLTTEMFIQRLGEYRADNLLMRAYMNPLIDGVYARDAAIKEASRELSKALGKIKDPKGKIKNDLFFDPDLYKRDGTIVYPDMNRTDAYALIANAGNNSNLSKLAGGYNIFDANGQPDIERVRQWLFREVREGRLHAEDFDKMQEYGKLTARIKHEADVAALKESDVPAENVPLEGFDAPWGKHYDGWYHRLTPHEYWEGAPQARDSVELEGPTYTRAATPRRYEKARTDAKYPLSFDFERVVRQSIFEQLHDIHLRGPIREMAKLLRDDKLRTALRTHYSKVAQENMEDWIKGLSNSAAREYGVDSSLMAAARWFRKSIVGNSLNFNPGTVMKHFTTALIRSAITVNPAEFALATAKLYTPIRFFMNKNIAHIMSTSKELPTRTDFWELTVTGAITRSFGKMGLLDLFNKVGRSPVALSDLFSVMPTYLAGFQKEFRRTGDEELAQIAGDRAVVEAHGSMNAARRPRVMGGNPLWASYMNFMSFFTTLYQAYYKGATNARLGYQAMKDGEWKDAFDKFFFKFFPLVFGSAIAVAYSDHRAKRAFNQLKETKDGWQGAIQKVGEGLHPFAAPLPIVNQIVEAMEQGGDSAFGIAASGANEIIRAVREIAKAIDEETHHSQISRKTKSNLIQHVGGGVGNLLGGFPGRPIARSAANIHRMATGQAPQIRTGWDAFWYLMGARDKPPKSR